MCDDGPVHAQSAYLSELEEDKAGRERGGSEPADRDVRKDEDEDEDEDWDNAQPLPENRNHTLAATCTGGAGAVEAGRILAQRVLDPLRQHAVEGEAEDVASASVLDHDHDHDYDHECGRGSGRDGAEDTAAAGDDPPGSGEEGAGGDFAPVQPLEDEFFENVLGRGVGDPHTSSLPGEQSRAAKQLTHERAREWVREAAGRGDALVGDPAGAPVTGESHFLFGGGADASAGEAVAGAGELGSEGVDMLTMPAGQRSALGLRDGPAEGHRAPGFDGHGAAAATAE